MKMGKMGKKFIMGMTIIVGLFYNNLVLAVPTNTAFNPWIAHNQHHDPFVLQRQTSWCRIICADIVLKDISIKYSNPAAAVPGHIHLGNLNTFLNQQVIFGHDFHEFFLEKLFNSGRAIIDMDIFYEATPGAQGALTGTIDNFFNGNYGHFTNCNAAPGVNGTQCANCMHNNLRTQLTNIANIEKKAGVFTGLIEGAPLVTRQNTWSALAPVARKMFYGEEDQYVNTEIQNICGVTAQTHNINAGNLQNSLTNIRNEIVNHGRMVIVGFKNPANSTQAHACVAYRANNDGGYENLWIYDPMGSFIYMNGRNPGLNHNINIGRNRNPVHWDIYQYTTFNY
ncbi:MAG: hypothetical protein LBI41_05075 [Lactobacillales bacterium]|jgi:hypothetical protein|nr:hypothetical protein [Lactobacillales bacterium]